MLVMPFSWSIPMFGAFPVPPGQSVVCLTFNSRAGLSFILEVASKGPPLLSEKPGGRCRTFSTFVLEQEVGDRFLTGLGHSLSDWAVRGHVLLLTDHSKWDENQSLYPEGYSPAFTHLLLSGNLQHAQGKGASAPPVKHAPDHFPVQSCQPSARLAHMHTPECQLQPWAQ